MMTPSSAVRPCRIFDLARAAADRSPPRACAPCRPRRRTRSAARSRARSPAPAASGPGLPSAPASRVMNMPGRRRPSRLSISARIATERVVGSTRVSMLATRPVNVESGYAVLRAWTVKPGCSVERNTSGTEKSSLTTLRSSSVVMTVPGLTSLPRLTLRKPTRPPNGARDDAIVRDASAQPRHAPRSRAASPATDRAALRTAPSSGTAPGCACTDCGCRSAAASPPRGRRAPLRCRARSARRPCEPADLR